MKKRIFATLVAVLTVLALLPIGAFAEEHVHAYEGGNLEEIGDHQHSYVCSCGEEVVEDCIFEYYTHDSENHWIECNNCYNFIDSEPHTLVDCACTDPNCEYNEHTVASWAVAEDPSCHSGECTTCHQTVTEPHGYVYEYTDEAHWWACNLCGHMETGGEMEHILSDEYINAGGNRHVRFCHCGYQRYEVHVDEDGDGICDEASCGTELCVNNDGDHICDDCLWNLVYLCSDSDGDHVCDNAICLRNMTELCVDEDGDEVCDLCEAELCEHYIEVPVSDGTGKHTGECLYCEKSVAEDCMEYSFYYDSHGHQAFCVCGFEFERVEHTYEEEYVTLRSVAGHWIVCDECFFYRFERHAESEGECETCGQELEGVYDVYVGGVGLLNGQYLDTQGNKTSTAPEGGYAYYKDGVLTLNDYVYDGSGFLWVEELDGNEYSASIFSPRSLILMLNGENRLSYGDNEYADGIGVVGDLTVRGGGSLTILATDDGIQVRNGSFRQESGSLQLGILEYNPDGTVKENVEIDDDGIDVDGGDLEIIGGTIKVNADDHGFDVSGNAVIAGGTVSIVADDDGIDLNGDLTVGGATVTVEAEDHGFDSSCSSILIKSGTVTIKTNDANGISALKTVKILGGKIRIDAGNSGIGAAEITVAGGELTVHAEEMYALQVMGGKLKLSGGTLELTTEFAPAVNAVPEIGKHGVVSDPQGNPIAAPAFDSLQALKIDVLPCENFSAWTSHNEHQHVRKCEDCLADEYGLHEGGTATCTQKATCSVCGAQYGTLASHVDADGDGACDVCNVVIDEDSRGPSGGVIAAIAGGSAAVVAASAFAVYWFVIRKKKLK